MEWQEYRKKLEEFLKEKLSPEDCAIAIDLAENWVVEYEKDGVYNAMLD